MTAGGQMTPQETVERALAAARRDECVVLAAETSSANLRWAGNTLTTNGVTRSRRLTVIAAAAGPRGTSTGVVSRTGVRDDHIPDVVAEAEKAASESSPAEDACPLLAPGDPEAYTAQPGGAWDDAPASTGIGVFETFAGTLGEAFGEAVAAGRKLYGYAEHSVTSTFLGTSTGLRMRHDQPTGKVDITGKAGGGELSAWAGQSTHDFTDVDVPGLHAELARGLGWAKRRVDLPPGRYQTLLSPSAMADILVYLMYACAAKDALDGRTVFSRPGGGTRIGDRLASLPVTLRSDPGEPGLATAPFVISYASSSMSSVFDNGLALRPTTWIRDGELAALIQTRHTARRSGTAVTPLERNLVFDGPQPGGPSLDELIAGTERGLLVTCLWYIREVDPQTLLLTGLTRDGVYLVENGEVIGAANNFRFNDSPVSLLGRLAETGTRVPALARESGNYFQMSVPPVRVEGFNMSSVSEAS
jgi:predicted Zn-dependent protease